MLPDAWWECKLDDLLGPGADLDTVGNNARKGFEVWLQARPAVAKLAANGADFDIVAIRFLMLVREAVDQVTRPLSARVQRRRRHPKGASPESFAAVQTFRPVTIPTLPIRPKGRPTSAAALDLLQGLVKYCRDVTDGPHYREIGELVSAVYPPLFLLNGTRGRGEQLRALLKQRRRRRGRRNKEGPLP